MVHESNWQIGHEKFLTPQQLSRLVTYCKTQAELDEHRNRKSAVKSWMTIHLGSGCGLRVAEIADLRIGDCRTGYGESHIVVRNGKGNKRGEVILGKELKEHLNHFIALKKKWGEPVGADDHLLLSERKSPFTRSALQKKFKTICKRAELPSYFSIHSLRHTFCCELLRASGNLRLVQKQARHSNVSTTTVYADVMSEDIADAMDMLS